MKSVKNKAQSFDPNDRSISFVSMVNLCVQLKLLVCVWDN